MVACLRVWEPNKIFFIKEFPLKLYQWRGFFSYTLYSLFILALSLSILINLLIVYNKTPLLFGKDIRVNLYLRGLFITRFQLYVHSCYCCCYSSSCFILIILYYCIFILINANACCCISFSWKFLVYYHCINDSLTQFSVAIRGSRLFSFSFLISSFPRPYRLFFFVFSLSKLKCCL